MSLSASQCRMARAALGIGVRDLAKLADVSPNTVARLERGERLHRRTKAFLRGVLETEGLVFLDGTFPDSTGGTGVMVGDGRKSRYAELFNALWSLPDFRRKPDAALNALAECFEIYLDVIEDDRRQPDVWERLDLNGALGALAGSNPYMAFAFLRRGITPPDNQAKDYPIPETDAEQTRSLDLAYFRRGLGDLRARR